MDLRSVHQVQNSAQMALKSPSLTSYSASSMSSGGSGDSTMSGSSGSKDSGIMAGHHQAQVKSGFYMSPTASRANEGLWNTLQGKQTPNANFDRSSHLTQFSSLCFTQLNSGSAIQFYCYDQGLL